MPRLLLVDDNPSINRIVASLLGGTSIEVTYAKTASEALGLLDGEVSFDLAMLDASLPDMDGWELLGRVRENPKAANMPVAMMVGVLEDVDHAKAESAPMQALLLKPVDFRDLPERVQGIIAAGVSARVASVAAILPTAPAAAPAASAGFADSDVLILEEQDLVMDAEEGLGADADVPSAADAFSLNLETLNLGEAETPAAGVEEEAFIPLPDLESHSGPSREDTSDFIDASPEDFDFGQSDTGAPEIDAPQTPDATGDGGEAAPDEAYAAQSEEPGPAGAAASPDDQEGAAPAIGDAALSASSEHGAEGGSQPGAIGAIGDVALLASSVESELLSDKKFIDAVARAVAKVVADRLSH
jgi:CheY-like chemotaxis protein